MKTNQLIKKMFMAATLVITVQVGAQDLEQVSKEKLNVSGIAVKGIDGWQFLKSELSHLASGPFWGARAAQTSKATNPEQKDPMKAIVNYNQTLKKENIRLVLVPIPPKAVIYPDKLSVTLSAVRHDAHLQQFYKLLKEQGVDVLDVTPILLNARKSSSEPQYCLGDSHLSGEGCRTVSKAIAKHLNIGKKNDYRVEATTVEMTGDLYTATGHAAEQRMVYRVSGGTLKDSNAPVVLMGDSHTLVYDIGGDLFAQDSGIASLLAAEIGQPIEVVGVRGSGATPARINFFRRSKANKKYISGKRVVVWCFAAREFTEAKAWHPNIPVK